MRKYLSVFLAVLLLAVFASQALAEHLFGPDELDTTYGAYFRFRQETWDNVFDFDHSDYKDDNFFRLKTSLWTKLDYDKKYIFFLKLTNEARYYMNSHKGNFGLDEDELVIDNLYVEAKDVLGLPVDVKIGRQDFLFTHGEGFVIMDGTPMDGSRTFYFNAAKVNVKVSKTLNFDLIYITDPQTDTYLPSLHGGEKKIVNISDEEGYVLYVRSKPVKGLTFEPYYIFKNEDTPDALDINTLGAHVVYKYKTWILGGEYAHQWGDYDSGKDRTGNGGYVYVKRKYPAIKYKPGFELRYVYLSGDDPNTTDKVEAWDPVFSRWPWLSELFILTLAPETGIPAYWTNLQIYRAAVALELGKKTRLALAYNKLLANENIPGHPLYNPDGDNRGDLFQGKVSYKFNKHIDAYLIVEHMRPGSFYKFNDGATFVRWQVQIKI